MEFLFRQIKESDLAEICRLPQTEEELYFMFPKAAFPLTVEQFSENLKTRLSPTVFLEGETIIGFANFYEVKQNESCWLGNVIVNAAYRGKGAGRFIVRAMERLATEQYHVKELFIACFNDNLPALRMYHRMGYVPFGMEERLDRHGNCRLLFKLSNVLKS